MRKKEKKLRYDAIAYQIGREDTLINYRLTWTLTLNGFLIATLGFLDGNSKITPFLNLAIPATGFFVSFFCLLGTMAAYWQINYLTEEWEILDDNRWPRPFGDKKSASRVGAIPSYTPSLLVLFWLGYFIYANCL